MPTYQVTLITETFAGGRVHWHSSQVVFTGDLAALERFAPPRIPNDPLNTIQYQSQGKSRGKNWIYRFEFSCSTDNEHWTRCVDPRMTAYEKTRWDAMALLRSFR